MSVDKWSIRPWTFGNEMVWIQRRVPFASAVAGLAVPREAVFILSHAARQIASSEITNSFINLNMDQTIPFRQYSRQQTYMILRPLAKVWYEVLRRSDSRLSFISSTD